MARLELTLLGGFQARLVPGGAITLPTRKAQALLAYLALPAGRLHPRDSLAALLWGDVRESALHYVPDSRPAQEQRFELALGLARARYRMGEFDRAMDGYRDAERLAHALGDERRLGQVLGALVYSLATEGRYPEAIDAGERALAIAETTADRSLQVWASIGLGRS
jgi:tetratricopeptide (TPR) repeat protein